MVDREARRKYAELVRQFISGRITNDEYEDQFKAIKYDPSDVAIDAVYYTIWFLYDDFKTHRLAGAHRLDRKGRREVAQAVLFLQLGEEYQWPNDAWIGASRALFLVIGACLATILLGMFPADYLLTLGISFSAALFTLLYLGIRIPIERGCGKRMAIQRLGLFCVRRIWRKLCGIRNC